MKIGLIDKMNTNEIIKNNEKLLARISNEIMEVGKLFSKMTILEEDYVKYRNRDVENRNRDVENRNRDVENRNTDIEDENIRLIQREKYKINKQKFKSCICSGCSICVIILLIILTYKN